MKLDVTLVKKMAAGNDELSAPVYKFCKSRVVNRKVKCKNCATYFHTSCATKKSKKCCENEHIITINSQTTELEPSKVMSKTRGIENDQGIPPMKQPPQVEFLKRLVKELEDKNLLLTENCNLWKSRAIELEKKWRESSAVVGKQKQNKIISNENSVLQVQVTSALRNRQTENPRRHSDRRSDTKENTNPKNEIASGSETIELERDAATVGTATDIYNSIFEPTSPTSSLPPLQWSQVAARGREKSTDQQRKILQKRRGNSNRQTGTRDEENGDFQALKPLNKNKKIWLFLSKVKNTVTVDTIQTYILKNIGAPPTSSVSIKLCEVKKPNPDHLSFMIGVDPEFKDTVYRENFWPSGVRFERFNFGLGRNFLEANRRMSSNLING